MILFCLTGFLLGEEPSGQRVNSCHSRKRTESIPEALETDEVLFLRNLTFGKVIALYENPPFSGAFGHFIMVRRLKTIKKYEIWILFAGCPIRFSLREFAIVTGLNCHKLPIALKKMKNPLREKPYWNELFGSLKSCTMEMVVDMLKNHKVKDQDRRIKFACLAITSSVLLPSSHFPKIIPVHVEMIRDLEEFLAYPWGRVSFQHLMSTLVKKDEIALAQNSFVLQGFVDAIQLVMIAAVPALKEEVMKNVPVVVVDSESESDSPRASRSPPQEHPVAMAKYVLILGHAKEMDVKCQVPVRSILNDLDEEWGIGKDFAWDDETNDTAVDTFVRLIQECFVFRREMFKGGLTTAEISRMRGEKLKEKEAKEHQEKEKQDKENANDPKEADVSERRTRGASGVNILAGQVREELLGMDARVPAAFESHVETIVGRFGFEKKISDLQKAVSALNEIEGMVNSNISGAVKDMQESVTKSILDFLRNPISSAPPGPFSSPSGSGSGESQHEDNADRTDNATDEAGIGKSRCMNQLTLRSMSPRTCLAGRIAWELTVDMKRIRR